MNRITLRISTSTRSDFETCFPRVRFVDSKHPHPYLMRTIALALLGALSMAAPLHAKAKPFKVKNVTVVSVTGDRPKNDPKYKKGSIIDVNITQTAFKSPKLVSLPITSKSSTQDSYFNSMGVLQTATATVQKSSKTGKPIGVTLTILGPVTVFGSVTSPATITYTLVPK